MGNIDSIYSINKIRFKHENHYLTKQHVKKLYTAGERAFNNKTPLNRFITIHYDDIADKKYPQKFITKLLEHTRKWLQRRGLEVAYLWVIENAPIKGIHVHLMINIPEGHQVAYKKALRKWLPFEWSKTRVDIKRTQHPQFGKLHSLSGLYGRLRYVCKGVDPNQAIFNITPKYQGKVFGRRWGISRLLQ